LEKENEGALYNNKGSIPEDDATVLKLSSPKKRTADSERHELIELKYAMTALVTDQSNRQNISKDIVDQTAFLTPWSKIILQNKIIHHQNTHSS
jgi:hypothetical protein